MNHDEQPHNSGDGQSEQVKVQHVSARVPDKISRGAFSTGVIVMTGGSEFILDFIQSVGQPAQIAARVIMPHGALPQFIDALKKNVEMYTQRFGPPPDLPKPDPNAPKPTAQQIYDDLKIPDDQLAGSYANAVMIGHTPSEFKFDFISNLFPQSAVSNRVFLSAPQVPRFLDSMQNTFKQFQERVQQQRQQQQDPKKPPEPPEPPEAPTA